LRTILIDKGRYKDLSFWSSIRMETATVINVETENCTGDVTPVANVPTCPKLTESIWFWVYLFSTAALIILFVMQSKISSRQNNEQRNFQARQQTYENVARPDNPTNVTQKTARTVTTTPLFIIMGITFAVSWIMLCRQRFFKRNKTAIEPTASSTHLSN
jgi:uncharacterized membrane protein YhaH (DUF805 family)